MSNNYGLEHSAIVDDLMKWERSDDLASATKEIHAHNHAIARPLATLAGYAYADNYRDLEKIARKVFDSHAVWVKHFHMRADGMLLESAADLIRVRTAGGHLGILCYRGTRPQDLISILGVLEIDSKKLDPKDPNNPVPSKWEGSVHSGFYRNFMATRDDTIEALNLAVRGSLESADDEKTDLGELQALYISGHSLGGAMAVLMAVTLATEQKRVADKVRAVYTFGQPMIGDQNFANYCKGVLNKKLIRYIYRQDLVPRVPPGLSEGYFEHFGDEYRFDDKGWYYSEELTRRGGLQVLFTPVSWLERRVDLLPGRAQRWLRRRLYSFDDHGPYNYIDALMDAVPLTDGYRATPHS